MKTIRESIYAKKKVEPKSRGQLLFNPDRNNLTIREVMSNRVENAEYNRRQAADRKYEEDFYKLNPSKSNFRVAGTKTILKDPIEEEYQKGSNFKKKNRRSILNQASETLGG